MFRLRFSDIANIQADYSGPNSCTRPLAPPPHACRFLLNFDDGPDTGPSFTTSLVLEQLPKNRVQPGVKAMFFVQTRNADGGGCEYGRFILHREHTEGHVLGLHSGTSRGHVSHIRMASNELRQSLMD